MLPRILIGTLLVTLQALALAHTDSHAKKADKPSAISTEEKAFGRQGDPKKVSRTINIDMGDTMRFTPAELSIKRGETIRFVVKNKGQVLHEMVIGTKKELEEHALLMKKHPNMEHDEPYMAHVGAGKLETLVWQFTKAGEFYYGCLVPGHFEAGMVGKIIVK
jgi:uncharacterized cupredoxin-like copper-binding protein